MQYNYSYITYILNRICLHLPEYYSYISTILILFLYPAYTLHLQVITMKLTSFAYSYSDSLIARTGSDLKEPKNTTSTAPATDSYSNNKQTTQPSATIDTTPITHASTDKPNSNNSNNSNNNNKVLIERSKYAIHTLPNILSYLGYMYSFTTILVGPSLEYNEYLYTINNNSIIGYNSDLSENHDRNPNLCPNFHPINRPIPSSLLLGLYKCSIGIICMICHLYISKYAPIKQVSNIEFIQKYSILYRYIYTLYALLGEKCKFYFVWKVAEGGCIVGGFGYIPPSVPQDGPTAGATATTTTTTTSVCDMNNNTNNSTDNNNANNNNNTTQPYNPWSGANNIDILSFECATNIQSLSRAWNKRTQKWLEKYTYLRTRRSLVMTYFVSALWHGLHPGIVCVV